jgi:hypothetical protein
VDRKGIRAWYYDELNKLWYIESSGSCELIQDGTTQKDVREFAWNKKEVVPNVSTCEGRYEGIACSTVTTGEATLTSQH